MANHKSAIKRNRQNIKRREHNRFARASIRTAIKASQQALEKGEVDEAKKLAVEASSLLDKAVVQGVLHKNNAARRASRLHSKIAQANK